MASQKSLKQILESNTLKKPYWFTFVKTKGSHDLGNFTIFFTVRDTEIQKSENEKSKDKRINNIVYTYKEFDEYLMAEANKIFNESFAEFEEKLSDGSWVHIPLNITDEGNMEKYKNKFGVVSKVSNLKFFKEPSYMFGGNWQTLTKRHRRRNCKSKTMKKKSSRK